MPPPHYPTPEVPASHTSSVEVSFLVCDSTETPQSQGQCQEPFPVPSRQYSGGNSRQGFNQTLLT